MKHNKREESDVHRPCAWQQSEACEDVCLSNETIVVGEIYLP